MTATTMLQPRRSPLLRDRAAAAAARGSWPLTIVLIALVVATALLLLPVTGPGEWLLPAALGTVAVLGAAQAVRSLTGSPGLGVLGMLIALAIAAIVVSRPNDPLDAVTVLGRRFVEFGAQLPNDLPPLRESPAVIAVLAMLVMLIATLVDLAVFGLRAPMVALVPLAVLPTLPAVLGQPAAPGWAWTLCLGLVIAMLYASARWRRRCEDEARAAVGYTADRRGAGGLSGALVSGAAAVAIAALLSALLPVPSGALWQQLAPVPSLSVNRVNPIIDLGDDLRREHPADMLRYATSQTEGQLPYLSLVSLTRLEADSEWGPAEFAGDGAVPSDRPVPPSGMPDVLAHQGPETQRSANIIVNPGVTPNLPHFHFADVFADVPENYRRDEATGDIRERDGEAFGLSYHVTSWPLLPGEDELATLVSTQAGQLAPYVELPDDEAALAPIRAAMAQVVDPQAGPYAQALQLQRWFTGGAFDYSEQAPVAGGYDGTNLEVLAAFLEARSGYCVHFASAMAVMGRMLDIPTRIQVGFTPGVFESVNAVGQPVYAVTTDDLHAWAEFWVPGYGWVPFETTPADGLGALTVPPLDPEGEQEAQPTETPEPTQETAEPTPTPTQPDVGATDEPEPSETDPAATAEGSTEAPLLLGPALGILVAGLAVAALVALALAAPGLVRRRRRNARRARVDDGAPGALAGPDRELHAAAAAWREALETARDHGLAVPRGTVGAVADGLIAQLAAREAELAETASEAARAPAAEAADAIAVEPSLDDARAALERLGAARDRAAFAAPEPEAAAEALPSWDDVELVSAAIRARSTPAQLRRARLRPASVLGAPGRLRRALRRGRRR